MKKMNSILTLAVLLGCTSVAAPQAEKPLYQHTITEALDSWITNTERHLMPVADVMPEDKYSFAPAPTSGAFKDVRTFAQQLKHLAANNYLMAAFILGRKGNTELNNETGPESIKTKAEITEYLRGSFVALHNAVATIDNNNVVEPMTSPSSWQKTRLSFAVDAVAHSFNHYGQLAEYLRMNGIVPPDSRTPEALLLLPSVLAVPEIVTFSSGEITLHGVLYKPEGTGPFPAVIYNHGSAPGMMSKEAFAALGPVFASHRWVFFGPYRRGQGLSASAGPYIGDQIAAAEKAGGASAAAATMVRLLETDHLDDQFAALAWLRKQSFVQPNRIAVAGTSFGGIETVLGVERGGYCAGIDSAGGAQSWAEAPELQSRMTRAVRNAKAPIFFFQAANDFDLSPSKTLSAEMNEAGKTYKLKIYPTYGDSSRDGHSFGYFGADVWAEDVFGFLKQYCTK